MFSLVLGGIVIISGNILDIFFNYIMFEVGNLFIEGWYVDFDIGYYNDEYWIFLIWLDVYEK